MSNVGLASQVRPSVEPLIVPVPRTSAVVEVWSEFALALGVPMSHINDILRKGLDNYLIGSAIIYFFNSTDEVVLDVELKMDWKKHQMMVGFEPNITLCAQRPFTEQLHSSFRRLLVYLRRIKAEESVARVELRVRFRDERNANPELLEQARAALGLVPGGPLRYAQGVRQPDMTFRFAPIPETTFVVRE